MSRCCNGTCQRAQQDRQPIQVLVSDLTGRAYAVLRYRQTGEAVEALEKHEVTPSVRAIQAAAWERGIHDLLEVANSIDSMPANPYQEKP